MKNKTKHTPGPWKAELSEDYLELHVWNHNTKIAVVNDPHYGGRELAVHNAALIAAAPEMLEALEVLVAHAPNNECENNIRALIKKAKGEE